MRNRKNNGGPAFPINHELICSTTLRDYFAAMAMQGLLASLANPECTTPRMVGFDVLAQDAFRLADAMLKEREHFPSDAE